MLSSLSSCLLIDNLDHLADVSSDLVHIHVAAQLAPQTQRARACGAFPWRGLEDAAVAAKSYTDSRPPGPRLFTESTVVHFVQADLRPAGTREKRADSYMFVKAGGQAHDGSGNQTPLGGKLTRTRPRGEDRGAFQTVGYARGTEARRAGCSHRG